jgi:cytoskeletal protein CcmA (bactofilin family)
MLKRNHKKVSTLIGCETTLKGEIELKGTIRIDGTVEGNVTSDWITVGAEGAIKGNVHARGVIVGGTIEGNIMASEIVEIMSKGKVFGDIFSAKLTIMEGGFFEGRSKIRKAEREEKSDDEMPQQSVEY